MAAIKRNIKVNPIDLPCKKTMYNSLEEGLAMIAYLQENRTGRNLSAYKCSTCGFWHLTSKANREN